MKAFLLTTGIFEDQVELAVILAESQKEAEKQLACPKGQHVELKASEEIAKRFGLDQGEELTLTEVEIL